MSGSTVSNPVVRDEAWVVSFPDEDRLRRPSDGPTLWSASAQGVSAAISGTLFEPELLAQQLGLPGDAALNPANLALHAYLQSPERWLHTIKGHYAVIVDDRRRNRFFAARDAMGLHPLFFADANGALLVSWSTDVLASQPGVSRKLNRVALAEHLVHRWPDATDTYYEAIRRVPPGHVLEAGEGGRRLRRYWDPSASGGVQWLKDEEVEQFDQIFDRAVTRCLMRGRPGIFLSGGFDSVSIAAVATDNLTKMGLPAPRALSLGFPDPTCDEQVVQRRVAQSLGMPQDLVPFAESVGERGLLGSALEMASSWASAPMMNIWNPAYAYLARRGREKGCTTILTGSGGDEWLTVSPYLAADNLRRGRLADVLRQIQTTRRFYEISTVDAIRNTLWRFGARPIVGMLADRVAPGFWSARRGRKVVESTPAWIAPDSGLRKQLDERAGRVLSPAQPHNNSFYEREMRTALEHPLISQEAEEHFEMGRRLGLQIVHPYWDSDLVDLLYRTAPRLLSKNGQTKGLVRETVARRFPKFGFDRQKKVRATEFYWKTMQTEGRKAWEALGQATALADMGVVEPSLLSKTLAELFAGQRAPESYRIWNTLHLEAWARARA